MPKKENIQHQVRSIIRALNSDQRILGGCQTCGSSAPLVEWDLFHNDDYPENALPKIQELNKNVENAKQSFQDLVAKSTKFATKKSLEVNIGKVVEKVLPALPTFPYQPCDCRTLFDPIDYLVFDGLTKKNKVTQIHFVEVKTGSARLNEHQKQVKSVVERKRLEFKLYEGNHTNEL